MNKKRLQIQQLEAKLKIFLSASKIEIPPTGWINAIRTTLGMSLQQLGEKLSLTRQSVQELEQREREGTVSLNSLKEIANALDMQFIYGFVPKDGSLDELIDRKARELAYKIVMRTSNTMKLEDQEVSKERIKKAVDERTAQLKNELPKILWD
jgi:predicted DNA-binding mobile mystery protein A